MTDLEEQVADEFKTMQFSTAFVEAVVRKTREMLDANRKNAASFLQGIVNQKTSFEIKRDKLEDALLDNTIDRETFKRKHAELQTHIANLEAQTQESENKRKVDIDLIEEVLSFTRNIYRTYMDAPGFLKRHYLRFFFEKLFVEDKRIVRTVPTPIFATLRDNQQVIISRPMLPRVDSDHEPSSYK